MWRCPASMVQDVSKETPQGFEEDEKEEAETNGQVALSAMEDEVIVGGVGEEDIEDEEAEVEDED